MLAMPTLSHELGLSSKGVCVHSLRSLGSKGCNFFLNPKPSASSTPSWSSTDVYGFTHCSHLDRAVQWLIYQQRLMDLIRHMVGITPVFTHWLQWEILSPWAEGRPGPSFHNNKAFYLPNIHRNSSHVKCHVQAV